MLRCKEMKGQLHMCHVPASCMPCLGMCSPKNFEEHPQMSVARASLGASCAVLVAEIGHAG